VAQVADGFLLRAVMSLVSVAMYFNEEGVLGELEEVATDSVLALRNAVQYVRLAIFLKYVHVAGLKREAADKRFTIFSFVPGTARIGPQLSAKTSTSRIWAHIRMASGSSCSTRRAAWAWTATTRKKSGSCRWAVDAGLCVRVRRIRLCRGVF
jgi:hypothetical protein